MEQLGEATPYDLKSVAASSTNVLVQLPHTQIYTQCERLVAEGLPEWRDDPTVVPVPFDVN